MRKYSLVLILILIFGCRILKQNQTTSEVQQRGDVRIMFYNCENFFDTKDDPKKWDDEFTADGKKHWTDKKFWTKVNHIYKVIIAVGGWQPPEIIGLCEVENRQVLDTLIKYTPLRKFNYQIVHYESPDRRGIDVALLYLPNKFKVIKQQKIPVNFPKNMGKKTRDILYVKGLLKNGDTLHVFVNHWPSRWGGKMETDPKRFFVAQLLRSKVDSIFKINSRANIVIIGDFNDFPTDRSLLKGLKAKGNFDTILPNQLYNLSYYLQEVKGEFSHKHQGEGGILDQIIVSGALLDKKNPTYTTIQNAHIYKSEFLLVKDEQYVGYKPYRTYIGYKYIGGYSDHLPVYLDLFFKK